MLATIHSALTTLGVTVNAITPPIYSVADLPPHLNAGQLPARLILPYDPAQALSGEVATISLTGALTKSTWRVYDLLLWGSAVHGGAEAEFAPVAITYPDAYTAAVRAANPLGNVGRVTGLSFDTGTFVFGDLRAFGVKATLTVVRLG